MERNLRNDKCRRLPISSSKSRLDLAIMVDPSKSSERHLRAQQAKEFLISQIVEEAQKENVSLSEVERKMLYFTEAEDSLPDIYEVNDQFEREYDNAVYEKKIARLLRNAYRRSRQESLEGESRWKQAIADLRKGDHYLLVMVDQSLQPSAAMAWGIGIGISIVISLLIILWTVLDEKGLIPKWVLGWISDDPLTRKLQFSLVILGLLAVWFVVKFAKLGVLGDIVKPAYNGILSKFSFPRPWKRFRR